MMWDQTSDDSEANNVRLVLTGGYVQLKNKLVIAMHTYTTCIFIGDSQANCLTFPPPPPCKI